MSISIVHSRMQTYMLIYLVDLLNTLDRQLVALDPLSNRTTFRSIRRISDLSYRCRSVLLENNLWHVFIFTSEDIDNVIYSFLDLIYIIKRKLHFYYSTLPDISRCFLMWPLGYEINEKYSVNMLCLFWLVYIQFFVYKILAKFSISLFEKQLFISVVVHTAMRKCFRCFIVTLF